MKYSFYRIISKLSSLIHSSTASLMIKLIASNPRMRLHEKWALNIVTHPQLPMLKLNLHNQTAMVEDHMIIFIFIFWERTPVYSPIQNHLTMVNLQCFQGDDDPANCMRATSMAGLELYPQNCIQLAYVALVTLHVNPPSLLGNQCWVFQEIETGM